MGKEDQKVGSSFQREQVTFESSFQSSIGGGGVVVGWPLVVGVGRVPKQAGRGVPFRRSQSPSRPVSAPFCARSALD